MSQLTESFDSYLSESVALNEKAMKELEEMVDKHKEEMNEAAKMTVDAVKAKLEDALGTTLGKITGEGDLGGGVKSVVFKAKLNDKQVSDAGKKLAGDKIFLSNMAVLGELMVSFKG